MNNRVLLTGSSMYVVSQLHHVCSRYRVGSTTAAAGWRTVK
jgi:hypothetical protein